MSSPFVAEIRIFPFNFPPTGWAFCDGQLLPISQNTALFSLLGTFYGGDGKSTFALPDMQGSAPINQGQGAGLSDRFLGEQSGSQYVTLLISEIPIHSHTMNGLNDSGISDTPNDQLPAQGKFYSSDTNNRVNMNTQAVGIAGGSLPHNNMQPYLTVNFCIALQGVFPPR